MSSRNPGQPSREGEISVKLINASEYPREAIYVTWMHSRDRTFNMTTIDVINRCIDDKEFKAEVDRLFMTLLTDDLPLCEVVYFNFWIDDIPISLREQLVRHRIGMKPDPTGKFGVDIIPELSDSTWWSQTMRVMDMGTYYEEGRWMIPDTIYRHPEALSRYRKAMEGIQRAYQSLMRMGIPAEDARQVIPIGATHGMSWSVNLQALKHVIGKRSCWIAQSGMWHPLIKGMLDELCKKVDPAFRLLATPPCVRGDKFVGCAFHEENIRRIDGRDHMHPPCSLYFHNHEEMALKAADKGARSPDHCTQSWQPDFDEAEGACMGFNAPNKEAEDKFHTRREVFREFWDRDPETGKLRQPVL